MNHLVMDTVGQIGQVLARFGDFYWHPATGFQSREAFYRALSDWKEACALFLENYAFERAGRSPLYPQVAAEAVQAYPHSVPQTDLGAFLWREFLRRIAPQSPNERVNPLAPSTKFLKSIADLVLELGPEHSLVRWAKKCIEIRKAKELSAKIQEVRGIGPKIVAFFLRDVADAFEIDVTDPEEAIRLQPIDRWTRRGAEFLAVLIKAPKPQRIEECARVLLEVAQRARVRPTLVNSGLWVLGAQFAKTEGELREAFSSPEALLEYLQRWRDEYRARLELLEILLQNLS